MISPRSTLVSGIERWAAGLRYPWLLAVVALLFVADLFVPDMIPFVDEIVLGLVTLALSRIRRARRGNGTSEAERGSRSDG